MANLLLPSSLESRVHFILGSGLPTVRQVRVISCFQATETRPPTDHTPAGIEPGNRLRYYFMSCRWHYVLDCFIIQFGSILQPYTIFLKIFSLLHKVQRVGYFLLTRAGEVNGHLLAVSTAPGTGVGSDSDLQTKTVFICKETR